MHTFIYDATGKPVAFVRGDYLHDMHGNAVGQLRETHVYRMNGNYLGELHKGAAVVCALYRNVR